jgi:hypothetical protein
MIFRQREDGREMEGVRQSGGVRHRYALYSYVQSGKQIKRHVATRGQLETYIHAKVDMPCN